MITISMPAVDFKRRHFARNSKILKAGVSSLSGAQNESVEKKSQEESSLLQEDPSISAGNVASNQASIQMPAD